MPFCSVLSCKKNRVEFNIVQGGVTYHGFPKDDLYRQIWVAATGRVNWIPSPNSILCSTHFEEKYFLCRAEGAARKLTPDAIPTLNVLTFHPQLSKIKVDELMKQNDVSGSSDTVQDPQISKQKSKEDVTPWVPKKQIGKVKDYRTAVLKHQKLQAMLKWTNRKINLCNRRLRKHRGQIYYLKKKNLKIYAIMNALRHVMVENN